MILLKQILSQLCEAMTYNQLLGATDRGRRDRGSRMRTRSLAGTATEDSEQWNFAYKSPPDHNTTGQGHQGRISFGKDAYVKNKGKTSMNEVECRVDCSCPDYKYRWAYANYDNDAGEMGRDSLNQCNGNYPRLNNPALKVSLCKHLVSLRDYLKTKLDEGSGNMGEQLSRVVRENPVFEIQYEDGMMNEGNDIDKNRIKTALAFFIKLMKLESATGRIKLKYGHLDVDSESQLPTQASVHVSKSVPHVYTITMRSNNPMSQDEQIRHLAHEVKHIEQVETGRFDVYGNKWDGVTYPTGYTRDDYLKYPWERDARSAVGDMEIAFNRYMRDRVNK